MTTVRALVEDGGRLIARSDLDLNKVGPLGGTILHLWTHDVRCMRILKRVCSSQYIIHFLSFKQDFGLKLGLDAINVGTSAAEKAEFVHRLFCQQNVRACRAKKHLLCLL